MMRKCKLRRVAMARKVTPQSIIASNWPPIWNRWSSSRGLSAIAELLVYYSTPVGVQSIAINPSVCASVCLSVCVSVREYISGTTGLIFANFCEQFPCGCGLVLLRQCYATLCTSGFMDDVTFGRNGREAGKGWQHSALSINYVHDRGGVWCLWMLVF